MAVTNNEQMVDFPDLVIDTDAGATAVRHVFRNSAIGNSLQLNDLHVINTTGGAGAATVYLRIYDSLDPVVGTTDPEIIIMCPHGTATSVAIDNGIDIDLNVSYAVVQDAGTSGATAPGTTVTVHLQGSR